MFRILALPALLLLAGVAAAQPTPSIAPALRVAEDGPAKAPSLPACVKVKAYARYGAYGYDHLVQIDNGCTKTAACRVTTDVNPEPIEVEVGAASSETVVTFRGSPASEFKADVRCRLRD